MADLPVVVFVTSRPGPRPEWAGLDHVEVLELRLPIDDDFRTKPPELLQRGVDFALAALEDPAAKLYIHCAAGVHRAPMMTLAVLRAQGWSLAEAVQLIEEKRQVVDFADVYVQSVEEFVRSYEAARK